MAKGTGSGLGAASPSDYVLPFHAAVPRQGEPNREYAVIDSRGLTKSIKADAHGTVWPTSPDDVAVADANRLPVAASWAAASDPTTETAATAAQED